MSGAILSPCGRYRYVLWRAIPCAPSWVKPCLFVMLNPSKADAVKNDATTRRCIGFAKTWHCSRMTIVNLFGYRATKPKELAKAADAVGPENDAHVYAQLEAHREGVIVVAWGAHAFARRNRQLLKLSLVDAGAQCLGTTLEGEPLHPLRLRADTVVRPWQLVGA